MMKVTGEELRTFLRDPNVTHTPHTAPELAVKQAHVAQDKSSQTAC